MKIPSPLIYAAARVGSLIAQLLIIPIIAKSFQKEGIAALAISQALLLSVGTLLELGYNTSATRSLSIIIGEQGKMSNRARILFQAIQGSKLVFAVIATIILLLILPHLNGVTELEREAIKWAPLYFFGVAMTPAWCLQAEGKIGILSLSVFVPKIILGLVVWYLSSASANFDIYVISIYSAEIFTACIGSAVLRDYFSRLEPVKELANCWRLEIKSSLQAWVAILAPTISASAFPIVLRAASGANSLATYAVADKLVRTTISVLWPIVQVLYSQLLKVDKDKINETRRRSCYFVIGGAFFLLLLLIVARNHIVLFLYGPNFEEANKLILLLGPILLINAMTLSGIYFFYSATGKYSIVRNAYVFSLIFPIIFSWFAANIFDEWGVAAVWLAQEIFVLLYLVKFKNSLKTWSLT